MTASPKEPIYGLDPEDVGIVMVAVGIDGHTTTILGSTCLSLHVLGEIECNGITFSEGLPDEAGIYKANVQGWTLTAHDPYEIVKAQGYNVIGGWKEVETEWDDLQPRS